MVGFNLKTVLRNKKKNLALEIPQEKAPIVHHQSNHTTTTTADGTTTTQQTTTAGGTTSSNTTSTNSSNISNEISFPSVVINDKINPPTATLSLISTTGSSNKDYSVSQVLQDLLISWINGGKSVLLDSLSSSFYYQVNGGTPSEVVKQYQVPPNLITSIKTIYCFWYSKFSVSGVAPNRFINYECRILAKVEQPAGSNCDGTQNNSNQDGTAPSITLIQNIPFLMTLDEGTNSSGTIQFTWLPPNQFVSTPGGTQKPNPNSETPTWFGKNYFICLPTAEEIKASSNGIVYSTINPSIEYIPVWYNPLLATTSTHTSLIVDPKLSPPFELINLDETSLGQLEEAWNTNEFKQYNKNNNTNKSITTFGEVLGIWYYNAHPYIIDNFTPIFNCLVWYTTTTANNIDSLTTAVTYTTKYWCSTFEYWYGFGPSKYTGDPNKNFSTNLQNQNNQWIYNQNILPTWVATATSPNFRTTGPAKIAHFNKIYTPSRSEAAIAVSNIRMTQLENMKLNYQKALVPEYTLLQSIAKEVSQVKKSDYKTLDPLKKKFTTAKDQCLKYCDLISMVDGRMLLLNLIKHDLRISLVSGSTYSIKLAPSTADGSLLAGGQATMICHQKKKSKTQTKNTAFENVVAPLKDFMLFYTGTYTINTYTRNDLYNIPLVDSISFSFKPHGSPANWPSDDFTVIGMNSKGQCHLAEATSYTISKTPTSSSSSSSSRGIAAGAEADSIAGKNIFKPLTRGFWGDLVHAVEDIAEDVYDAAKAAADWAAKETEKAAKAVASAAKEEVDSMVKQVENNAGDLGFLLAGLAIAAAGDPILDIAAFAVSVAVDIVGIMIGGKLGHEITTDDALFTTGLGLGAVYNLAFGASDSAIDAGTEDYLDDNEGFQADHITVNFSQDAANNPDYEFWSSEFKAWEEAGKPSSGMFFPITPSEGLTPAGNLLGITGEGDVIEYGGVRGIDFVPEVAG